LLLRVRPADALTCGEVLDMLHANVPVDIVIQTIHDAGTTFSPEEVACLHLVF